MFFCCKSLYTAFSEFPPRTTLRDLSSSFSCLICASARRSTCSSRTAVKHRARNLPHSFSLAARGDGDGQAGRRAGHEHAQGHRRERHVVPPHNHVDPTHTDTQHTERAFWAWRTRASCSHPNAYSLNPYTLYPRLCTVGSSRGWGRARVRRSYAPLSASRSLPAASSCAAGPLPPRPRAHLDTV